MNTAGRACDRCLARPWLLERLRGHLDRVRGRIAATLVLPDDDLIAAVLTSEVSSGVGHTTQICVLPGYQGHGLGRMLMQTSSDALRTMKFRELTLTVTTENRSAVQLYESLGFTTIRTFTAGVWPR